MARKFSKLNLGNTVNSNSNKRFKKIDRNILTFSSPQSFTLATKFNSKKWNGTIEYSTDAIVWNVWSGDTKLSSSNDGLLYLRGTANTVISDGYQWILSGDNISCKGNIETLLDYVMVSNGEHPPMATNCYSNMFSGCVNLCTAPELPATTLTAHCYYHMFEACKSLIVAPELPATTLESGCYFSMFSGCTSLTIAPELPATTLESECYRTMFEGCTSLTNAPKLPATTLASQCCYYMFEGCTSLVTIPELPAIKLTKKCYQGMFARCTKIKISQEQTGEYATPYRIPKSGDGTEGTDSLLGMFNNTGGTFVSTPSINTTYYTSNTVV